MLGVDMRTLTPSRGFWVGVIALAVIDVIIATQVLTFIDYAPNWRCGTARDWVAAKVAFFSVLSLPVAFYVLLSYWSFRATLSPALRFAVRFPLACLCGLLLAFFVVFRFL